MQLPREHAFTSKLLKTLTRRGAAGALVVLLAGLVAGWLLPRGPVTASTAVLARAVALAVGFGPTLGVPVYIVEGQREAAGRETLAREWYGLLAAPSKNYIKFAASGHTPPFDEAGHFAKLMSDILTATKVP